MAEKKVIELEVKTESVQSLKAQLKEAQAQVQILSEKFGATSQQATEAAQKAAELKDAIGDAAALTDAFNPDAKFNALAGSIGGVISGVQAYEGALGLMGVESEAVEQTMLKLQAAMALTQGLQGLGESIDSFKQLGAVMARTAAGQKILNALSIVFTGIQKALNVVLNANPIFLIITGITLAIGAFKLFTSETESAEEANEKLNNSLEKQNELFELNAAKVKKNAENRRRLLEANGASEEELHKDTLRRLKEEENLRVRQMSMIEKQNAQRRKIYKKAMDEENYDIAKDIQKKIQEDNKKYKELALNNQEYRISVKEENKRFNDEQAKEEEKRLEEEKKRTEERQRLAKEALEKRKDLFEKRKANDIKEAEELIELIKKREKQEIDIIRQSSMTKEELAKRMAEQTNKLREDEYKDAKGFLEAQIIQDENNFTARLELLELEKQKELQNKELTEGEIAAIEARYAEERKKISDSEKEYKQRNQQLQIDAVKNTLTTIANLASLFAGASEKEQKKAFAIQKAANIAQATIDTYTSAVSAYRSLAGVPVVGPALGIAAAAAAITAGLMNIKQIASTKFESSSASGGGVSAATPSSGGEAGASGVMSPNFNIVGNAQATNPLAGLGNQPIQAYVVSGEVTTAQSLDRNRINYATFG